MGRTNSGPHNRYRWNGAWGYLWIDEAGLYLIGQRWYHPDIGRWMTPGSPDYVYLNNDPINYALTPEGQVIVVSAPPAQGGWLCELIIQLPFGPWLAPFFSCPQPTQRDVLDVFEEFEREQRPTPTPQPTPAPAPTQKSPCESRKQTLMEIAASIARKIANQLDAWHLVRASWEFKALLRGDTASFGHIVEVNSAQQGLVNDMDRLANLQSDIENFHPECSSLLSSIRSLVTKASTKFAESVKYLPYPPPRELVKILEQFGVKLLP